MLAYTAMTDVLIRFFLLERRVWAGAAVETAAVPD